MFFYDKTKLVYGGKNRNALTPFLMVSIWVDGFLAPRDSRFAYLHSSLSLGLTALALMLLVRQLAGLGWALGCAATWLFLPSTQAVHEFLATRYYMEGLLPSLIAVSLGHRVARDGEARAWSWAGMLLFAAAAALTKETYAFATFFSLFCLLAISGRKWPLVSVFVLASLYTLYRTWALGIRFDYVDMPRPGAVAFAGVLVHFGYMLTANAGGYLLALGIAALAIHRARQEWSTATVLAVLGLFAGSVLVLYPISSALRVAWSYPGTWYRASFALNTMGWVLGWVALSRNRDARIHALAALLFVVSVVPGSLRTRRYWDEYKRGYEIEGRFFLREPSRLVFSQVEAFWYLGDLGKLYGAQHPLVTSRDAATGKLDRKMLESYGTLWRRSGEGMIEDPVLFQELLARAR